jgi:hypothetical protein
MDPRNFNVKWKNQLNPDGVRPNKEMTNLNPIPIEASTQVEYAQIEYAPTALGTIELRRKPFAVQHLYTKYGELSTRLGTNLGN